MATCRSPKAPTEAWQQLRTLVNALFLRRYDAEYLEEMKGIADGAAAAGAKFDDRPIDLVDIVALNSDIEVNYLDSGLAGHADRPGRTTCSAIRSAPSGRTPREEHCSAFAATGPGHRRRQDRLRPHHHVQPVSVHHYNVWLDVKPAKGPSRADADATPAASRAAWIIT